MIKFAVKIIRLKNLNYIEKSGTLCMRIGGTLCMRMGGTLCMRMGGTLCMRISGTLS